MELELPAYLTELRKELIRRTGLDIVGTTDDGLSANADQINQQPKYMFSVMYELSWRGYLLG